MKSLGYVRWTIAGLAGCVTASPSSAYLYWVRPDFSGAPVRGNEPGIVLPLANATPAEIQANLVWNLRAALNVAALQCQFSPPLMTVKNYNTILSQHSAEFAAAYKTLNDYFRRTNKAGGARAFDTHTTRTYNGFSTLHAQIGFCETAGKIGRLALAAQRGTLYKVAVENMSEIRNSLVPKSDRVIVSMAVLPPIALPRLDDQCWDKRGNMKKNC